LPRKVFNSIYVKPEFLTVFIQHGEACFGECKNMITTTFQRRPEFISFNDFHNLSYEAYR